MVGMENAVSPVLEALVPQCTDGLCGKQRVGPRNEPESDDLLDAKRLLLRLRGSFGRLLALADLRYVVVNRIACDGSSVRSAEQHFVRDKLIIGCEARLAAPPPPQTFRPTTAYDAATPQVNAGNEHAAQSQQHPAQLGHRLGLYIAASCTASSRSTATSRETPGSCIVTPLSWCIASIVVLLCVMITNCTRSDISFTMSLKRPTLASSSGASTSSSRQNGAGLSSKIENTSATAVNAFSPPDNR